MPHSFPQPLFVLLCGRSGWYFAWCFPSGFLLSPLGCFLTHPLLHPFDQPVCIQIRKHLIPRRMKEPFQSFFLVHRIPVLWIDIQPVKRPLIILDRLQDDGICQVLIADHIFTDSNFCSTSYSAHFSTPPILSYQGAGTFSGAVPYLKT